MFICLRFRFATICECSCVSVLYFLNAGKMRFVVIIIFFILLFDSSKLNLNSCFNRYDNAFCFIELDRFEMEFEFELVFLCVFFCGV